MKKFLTLALALVMVLTLSVNVFAEDATIGDADGSDSIPSNDTEIPVTVVKDENAAAEKYKIDISWEAMNFTYEVNHSYNVTTHEDTSTGRWVDADAEIKITNHSNAQINYTATITPETETLRVATAFDDGETTASGNLGSAVNSGNTPPSVTLTVEVSGDTTVGDTATKVASVKIVIS